MHRLWWFPYLWLCTAPAFALDPLESLESRAMARLGAVQERMREPAEFTTDGCSGGLSLVWDGLAERFPGFRLGLGEHLPWETCCVEHDRTYWRGESEDGYGHRLRADRALRRCVLDTGGAQSQALAVRLGTSEELAAGFYGAMADAMYLAVRAGGGPCTGLPWRWGYGWPHCTSVGTAVREASE